MKIKIFGALLAVSAIAAGPAFAHHSFAMFDRTKKVTVEGTVKEFQWTNPHAWLQVMGPDGKTNQVVEWSFEMGGIKGLLGRGWTRTSMKPGDKVQVVAYPRKDGKPEGGLITVSVNGKPLDKPAVAAAAGSGAVPY